MALRRASAAGVINSNVTPNAGVDTAAGIMMTIAMSTVPMATVLISIP